MIGFTFEGFINAVTCFDSNYYFVAFKEGVKGTITLPKPNSEVLKLVSLGQLCYKNIKLKGKKNIGFNDWIGKSSIDEILLELEGEGLIKKQEDGEYLNTEKAQDLKYRYHYINDK